MKAYLDLGNGRQRLVPLICYMHVMAMDVISPGYLSRKKAEAPNSSEISQMWTELEDLHSKRFRVNVINNLSALLFEFNGTDCGIS